MLTFYIIQFFFCWINFNLIEAGSFDGDWHGKWFPSDPSSVRTNIEACDDGKTSIAVDFDPSEKRHAFNYQCLDIKRDSYEPKMSTQPLLKKYFVPPAYRSQVKCLNQSITFPKDELPTFGPHRLFPPKYGKYVFLPPQRWVHSLEKGAIVMLYHPCAFEKEITVLENIIKRCLYRHIISPTQYLSSERPLALLGWGRILHMSVVDERVVVDFINENAKKAPKSFAKENSLDKYYDAGLLEEAHLVTDESDSGMCDYMNM